MNDTGAKRAAVSPLDIDGRLCLALGAVAFATLLLEVDLIRLFSFLAWYHFAYLIISVAMLGFGAAGAMLARHPALLTGDTRPLLSNLCFASAVSVLVSYAVVTKVPFRPQALPNWEQFGWLTIYYVSVFVPFFFAGLTVALVLSAGAPSIGRLYFWDLIGAGIGSLATLGLMHPLGVPGTVMVGVVMLAVAALLFAPRNTMMRSRAPIACAIIGASILMPRVFPVDPSPAKGLFWFLGRSGAHLLSTEWHPVGRVDVLEYPLAKELQEVPWSMTQLWYGGLPADRRIFYDGGASPSIIRFDGNLDGLDEIDRLIQSTPYQLLDRPSVLVIGLGGGFDVLAGLRNRASKIVGVDVHPVTVDIVKRRYAEFAGHIYQRPNVHVEAAEGRNYVSRMGDTFDLIQMTTVDSLVARTMGAYILSENYLFTVEAVQDMLGKLAPRGIFSIVDGDPGPGQPHPHALRQAGIVIAALEERGVTNPADHMMVVSRHRGPVVGLINTLVRLTPFTHDEALRMQKFADASGFAVYHLPGIEPTVSDVAELIALTPIERQSYYREHRLNLRPTRDDSPFFFNFHKWKYLLANPTLGGMSREAPTGQIVLLTMLVQSIVFSILFIVAPLPRLHVTGAPAGTKLACLAYFSVLGIGFMFLEISFIQRFVLFLGNPAYAVSIVLAGLLVAAGVGSFTVHRSRDGELAQLRRATLYLVAVGTAYSFGLPWLFGSLLSLPISLRFVVALLLVLPLGLVLGRFLPIGVRIVARIEPALVPWAWGINTCMSVVSTVLAVILAMSIGFRLVSLTAVGLYVAGAALLGSVEMRRLSALPEN